MNKMTLMFLVVAGLLLRTLAHTPAETNAVVEAALDYLQQAYPDNWETNFIEVAEEEIPDTWMTFLGGDETNGWTHAEKRAAFDWYLASLGSADCRSLPAIGKRRKVIDDDDTSCRDLTCCVQCASRIFNEGSFIIRWAKGNRYVRKDPQFFFYRETPGNRLVECVADSPHSTNLH